MASIREEVIRLSVNLYLMMSWNCTQKSKWAKNIRSTLNLSRKKALDIVGATREMYSAFWEKAYGTYFDGAGVVILLLHSQTNMDVFLTLGVIISHRYLASGFLPIRLVLPSLIGILLGPTIKIPKQILLEVLIEYQSEVERYKIRMHSSRRISLQRK